ncbi:Gfo/Idh/MocA family oxidoreductase [bacterium]|nr:Gfo/Idh/MocA family oxidoreductase [bacterium]MCI0603625.1 Gfo/Idh/MocA family oxidoreductase [bacterium]
MDRINAIYYNETPTSGNSLPQKRGLIRALRESIPAPVQHAIARSVPVEVRDFVVSREVTGGLDWNRTPGFALRSDLFSFLRLNLSGREPLGILEPGSDAYHRYIEHVTRCFLGLRTNGTNVPIVEDVLLLQQIYPGIRQHLLPDLLLRWSHEYPVTEVSSKSIGVVKGAPDSGRTGEHRPDGFAIVSRLVREYYLPALQTLPAVRISAVVDPLPESSRTAKMLLPDADIYTDHRSMLDRSSIHGVLVATPPSAHFEIWTDTIGRGIPVFVEKPLLLSSQIASIDAVREELRLMIDFNRRFWPNYIRAQQLLRDQAIGSPVELEFCLHLDVLGWSKITMHRLNPMEGGVLHDLGCHAIDLATELIRMISHSRVRFP